MKYTDRRRSSRRPADRVARGRPQADLAEQDAAAWDDVVDVICIGSGAVGSRGVALAAAVVLNALDLSAELVTTSSRDTLRSASLATRLGVSDPETIEYLESVTDDIPSPPAESGSAELPIRFVEGPVAAKDERGTVLPTFSGAALQAWAAKCLASPGGMLSSMVADPSLTVTYIESGRAIETLLVGSVDFDPENAVDFEDWMVGWAEDNDVWNDDANHLQRLVFDSGVVAGAVLDAASGARIVRARHAVLLATGGDDRRCTWPTEGLDGVRTAQLAFVTRAASRFGRLELLVPNPRQ